MVVVANDEEMAACVSVSAAMEVVTAAIDVVAAVTVVSMIVRASLVISMPLWDKVELKISFVVNEEEAFSAARLCM